MGEEGKAMGLFFMHSFTYLGDTRVYLLCFGTILDTEAKTVNKVRFLLDCICKGVGVRDIN